MPLLICILIFLGASVVFYQLILHSHIQDIELEEQLEQGRIALEETKRAIEASR